MARWKRSSAINTKNLSSCNNGAGSKRVCDKLPDTNLWCLPNEILVLILRGLHIKDLLNLKSVHPRFCDLIDNHASIWSSVSFADAWPCKSTLKYYERGAKHRNTAANIKLGVAYLYNEGLPGDFEGKKITVNGERAADMFCQAEERLSGIVPFTFLFIRPPWSSRGACCKEYVFNNMVLYTMQNQVAAIHQCIARTLSLLEEDNRRNRDMTYHLNRASELGSSHAKYVLWQQKIREEKYLSKRHEVDELASFARHGRSLGAKLELCQAYAFGNHGSVTQIEAATFVRKFIDSAPSTSVNKMFTFQELSPSMRYILLDWLVEVANMKDYCSLTLHLAIYAVDRFLKMQKTTRGHLQLLGVSAMVLCSRFLGKDIITIREAAWLTDNTYNYEEVVRMMGEITATLAGNFRVLTCLDLVQILSLCGDFCDSREAQRDRECGLLSEYFCELTLLQSEFGEYRQGMLAASCVLLARGVKKKEHVWAKRLEEFSGFTFENLKPCVLHVHKKCFHQPVMKDHRRVQLEAVKHRYGDEDFLSVSDIQILSQAELQSMLGMKEETVQSPVIPLIHKTSHKYQAATPTTSTPGGTHSRLEEIINSPSRTSSPYKNNTHSLLSPMRQESATPTIEKKLLNVSLNDSMTGYLGDKEDEGEGLPPGDCYDSDLDLESLWCVDSIQKAKEASQDGDESDMEERIELEEDEGHKEETDVHQCLIETIMPEPCISPIKDNNSMIICHEDYSADNQLNNSNRDEEGHKESKEEGDEEKLLNLSMMSDALDICGGDDSVFEGTSTVSVFRERSNSLNESSLWSNKRRNSLQIDENLIRTSHSDCTDSLCEDKTHRGSLSLDSFCAPQHYSSASNVPRKTLSHSMTSPPISTKPVSNFNRSPFGGMSLFQVDTPNSAKYTHSGIKIDFSDHRKSMENIQKHPSNTRIESYLMDQTLSKASMKSSSTQQQSKTKASKSECIALSEKPLNRAKAFNIFRDGKQRGSIESEKNKINTHRHVLMERNFNIDTTFRKQSKKRKPTASLGNENKVQVISDK